MASHHRAPSKSLPPITPHNAMGKPAHTEGASRWRALPTSRPTVRSECASGRASSCKALTFSICTQQEDVGPFSFFFSSLSLPFFGIAALFVWKKRMPRLCARPFGVDARCAPPLFEKKHTTEPTLSDSGVADAEGAPNRHSNKKSTVLSLPKGERHEPTQKTPPPRRLQWKKLICPSRQH